MKFNFFHVVIITALQFVPQPNMAVESKNQSTYFQKVVKTAKERLGKKYSDQQRINNCKVPKEKRGSKPRPDKCHRVKH